MRWRRDGTGQSNSIIDTSQITLLVLRDIIRKGAPNHEVMSHNEEAVFVLLHYYSDKVLPISQPGTRQLVNSSLFCETVPM